MRKYLTILLFVLFFAGCKEYTVSDDPSLRLSFSTDTLSFDTVFTRQGSATLQLMVYNDNRNAILLDHIQLEKGTAFQVNIDGEADLNRLTHMQINGGDSLFVFVRVNINPQNQNNPVLVTDALHFHLASGTVQQVVLEAYGQDAVRIGHPGCKRTTFTSDYTFTADKPYILFDTVIMNGKLTFNAGARLYMHKGAGLYARNDVTANGTREAPVIIRGDRLDNLFDSVPYLYASGSWDGIYLLAGDSQNYNLQYVDILSGNIGLYCLSDRQTALPKLTLNGCRIHNHAVYGLVLLSVNAEVVNTEISNCASYCVYCQGGTHTFVHATVASCFGYTNIRIQSTEKEDVAAVYIHNLSKNTPPTVTSFYNSVITGPKDKELVLATPIEQYYPGTFAGNYIAPDTTKVFVNDYYKYKEYVYYDFRLDSLSPAIGIGDSLAALPYPTDRNGFPRTGNGLKPDAGCYQYQP